MIPSTIAAIATPAGRGGIGIIRISGPHAFKIGLMIFRPSRTIDRQKQSAENELPYKSHRFYHGHIHSFCNKDLLDEVLICFMRAPNTYTRENIVEIQGHAGIHTLRAILETIIESGAVLAEPGEFTKRAFLNGRIDLTQAEAVIDLINAKSNISHEIATNLITGGLKRKVSTIRETLVKILSKIEAEIDFPEEDLQAFENKSILEQINNCIVQPIQQLIKNHKNSFPLKDGLRTIIIGAPNVGKSSLMNCLSRKDKSIVTPHPGTTRDLIEEHVNFFGTPMVLADTAGIHDSNDPIEKIGIEKAENQIQNADLILFVIQTGKAFTKNEMNICKRINTKNFIIVFNKMDLTSDRSLPEMPERVQQVPHVFVSARFKTGLDKLKRTIEGFVSNSIESFHDPLVPNARHLHLLQQSLTAILKFQSGISKHFPAELLSIDISEAIRCISGITGEEATPDVLEEIFNEFCIGK